MKDDLKGTTPGTDATTGDEQGIGSGVGSGIGSQTVGGSIDGQGYGATSGASITGTDTGNIGAQQIPSEEAGAPSAAGADTVDTNQAAVLSGEGSGIPPRAANGSIDRDASGTVDAERVDSIQSGLHPDAGEKR